MPVYALQRVTSTNMITKVDIVATEPPKKNNLKPQRSTHNFNNCLRAEEHDRSYLHVERTSCIWKNHNNFPANVGDVERERFSIKAWNYRIISFN